MDFPHLEIKRVCFRSGASGAFRKSHQKLCHMDSGAQIAVSALGHEWHHALSLTTGSTPLQASDAALLLIFSVLPPKGFELLPWKGEQKPNIGVGPGQRSDFAKLTFFT